MLDEKKQKLNALEKILKINNLSLEEVSSYLNFKLTNSNDILNKKVDQANFTYNDVTACFNPKNEKVKVVNISGLDYENKTFLNTLLSIYRDQELFENLGKFDIDKFNDSLKKNSNFLLIEIDNKYMVHGDGNHRTLLMLFELILQTSKMKKNGSSAREINDFINNFTVDVPVIHLKHNNLLIGEVLKRKQEKEYSSNLTEDFLTNIQKSKKIKDLYIEYNKDNNNYNLYYKGFKINGLNSHGVISKMQQIDSLKLSSNIQKNNNTYVLYKDRMVIKDIDVSELKYYDNLIKNTNLQDISTDYIITSSALKPNSYNLFFQGKDYYLDEKIDRKNIDKFIKDNELYLNYHRTDNNEIIDYFNQLNDLSYKNISLNQALQIIDKVNKLDNLMLEAKKRGKTTR